MFENHSMEQETIQLFLSKLLKMSENATNYLSLGPKDQCKIYYQNDKIKRLCKELIAFKCPIRSCNTTLEKRCEFPSHLERVHGKFICTLCFDHQKLFLEEISIFENAFALRSHMRTLDEKKKRQGDPISPSSMVQSQRKLIGHPECKFCNIRFYSNDELYAHCRDAHESCFICTSNGLKDQYYNDYESLVTYNIFIPFLGETFPRFAFHVQ